MVKKIVVLISGNGSNLQAIIDAIDDNTLQAEIALVISNKAEAFGIERAKKTDIPCEIILPKNYDSKLEFDTALIAAIDEVNPDLVVLAGFMRILSDKFVCHYQDKLINIHPSLLPKYKGLHTHAKALANGDNLHGVSIHFVTPELDGGPIIAQCACKILPSDTQDTLKLRVQQLEHGLYPKVIQTLLER